MVYQTVRTYLVCQHFDQLIFHKASSEISLNCYCVTLLIDACVQVNEAFA